MGQKFSFTWWGMVSGLFWVPAGALNIFAIRNAGLAVSQGIVSSSIVMVSFVWGNLVFREPVKSELIAYFAVCLIMIGLYGMSYFSSPEPNTTDEVLPKQTIPLMDDKCVEEETVDLIHKKNESSNSLMGGESSLTSSTLKSKTPSKTPLEIEALKKLKKKTRVITICGSTYSQTSHWIVLGTCLWYLGGKLFGSYALCHGKCQGFGICN
ncbi:hypothetical protein HJC23_005128 [Cyclotella cryptica]|uniref:EamA domain-containing protein n=1 Tax=Cyclotella cryptica TaxID=29204 RepID=A0ABD3QGR4_9STRA